MKPKGTCQRAGRIASRKNRAGKMLDRQKKWSRKRIPDRQKRQSGEKIPNRQKRQSEERIPDRQKRQSRKRIPDRQKRQSEKRIPRRKRDRARKNTGPAGVREKNTAPAKERHGIKEKARGYFLGFPDFLPPR